MPSDVPAPALPQLPVQDLDTLELDPAVRPDLDALIALDETPVASIYTERQQRLLTEPLYSSWAGPGEGRPFLALANVGLYYKDKTPPVVPDGLLSLDVPPPQDLRSKEYHSYFLWLMGKPPEVVIEVVSDRRGGEDGHKLKLYASVGVAYYVIYDPQNLLKKGDLRGYVLHGSRYEPLDPTWLPDVGLGLKRWTGVFEGSQETWLRWCDREGQVIPTGDERAKDERRRADEAQRRADEAQRRADEERRRADQAAEEIRRLQERLRQLEAEPEP